MRASHQIANLKIPQAPAVATNSAGYVSRPGGLYGNAGMDSIRGRASIIPATCDAAE
jgi:hypothetical protein